MTENLSKTVRSEGRTLLLIGTIFFVYALSVGALVQCYLIPTVFPHLDLGDGLVILDSTGFNQIAKIKAAEILDKGWAAWELRPQGLSPPGIASIFYALWTPKPYSLLPFNALVHALSGGLVLWLLRHFFPWKPAVIGASIFVLNPAALEWVAQIHRDGIFILGNLLVLACLMQLEKGLRLGKKRALAWGLLCGLIGTSIAWVARTYWAQVLLVMFFLCVCLIVIHSWIARRQQGEA